jgi:hypothetical protein
MPIIMDGSLHTCRTEVISIIYKSNREQIVDLARIDHQTRQAFDGAKCVGILWQKLMFFLIRANSHTGMVVIYVNLHFDINLAAYITHIFLV